MFIANYGLKSIVQKAAMVARLPIAYSQDHPYTGLKDRARRETLDFITDVMPDALAFDTPRELMRHALSRVTIDGLYAEFGVNNGGTITYIARQKPKHTIHGFDSFEGLPEVLVGQRNGGRLFQPQRAPAESSCQRYAASGLV